MSVMALFRTSERVRLVRHPGPGDRVRLAAGLADGLVAGALADPRLHRPGLPLLRLLPLGAYLAFGMSAGSIIRTLPADGTERAMQWAALMGGAAILACQYFANVGYSVYAQSDFWLNSPAQVLTKWGSRC